MLAYTRRKTLSAVMLTMVLGLSGLVWRGDAAIEPPEGCEELKNPKITGTLVGTLLDDDQVFGTLVFAFAGKCRKQDFNFGPVTKTFESADFKSVSLAATLKEQKEIVRKTYISKDLVPIPDDGCFDDPAAIAGLSVHSVGGFSAVTPTLIVAKVTLVGVVCGDDD